MVDREPKPEENPYVFSPEELRAPNSAAERKEWFGRIIELQREGVENGVRPQNLRGLPRSLRPTWRNRVWNYWLERQTPEHRLAAMRTMEESVKHTMGAAREEPET